MIIIIPVFVLGFLTISLLFENLASDTEKLNMNIIGQSANIADAEITKATSLFFQVENDKKIKSFIQGQSYRYGMEQYDLYDIMNELKLLNTHNTVSVMLGFYLPDSNRVIADSSVTTLEEFCDITFADEEGSPESIKELFAGVGMRNHFITRRGKEDENVIMCFKAMNLDGSFNRAIVFALLNREVLISKMMMDDTENDFEIAIVGTGGDIILKSDGFDTDSIDKINGEDIIKVKSDAVDGSYIYTMKNGGLAGNVGYITLIFLMLMLITVFISVFLAYLHMQKMKKMILGVFNESKGLEDSLSEQLENAKERILSNLLHNIRTEAISGADSMSKYGISFAKKYFAVMTVSDTQTDNSEVFSSVEESAWTELNNIVKLKLAEMSMTCEMVRTGTNSYSYILNYDTSGATAGLKVLPAEILKGYSISINIGIGDETESPEKLYTSYEGSVSALRFGLNERPGEAVFYEEIHSLENAKIYYTVEKEKQLIRSIKMGAQSNVTEILDEIHTVNFKERHIPHGMLKRLIFNISLTVYKVLDEAYELDIEKHEKYGRVCQNLFRNDNSEECFAILREICVSLCDDIGKQSGEDAIKDQIVDYIAENYIDDSLSLEVLAEHLEISYHYLSRLFKEYLGTNFVSYLTLVRLEKAKELLKTTDHTIETIAEKTGFVGSNSLIRAFKKYYDITPGKFRKM